MVGYTYNTFVGALQNMAMIPNNQIDQNFTNILPSVIDYAEQRLYRELDLLSTIIADSSIKFTAGNRLVQMPTAPHFIVLQQVNVITPSGSSPSAGERNALTSVSKEYLDAVWSSASGSGVPENYAMFTDQSFIVGPWPDDEYTIELTGTIRPSPLSKTNQTTFLSEYLPDLFMAASMIFVAGYQQNFGAQADNPQMAQSWENQYQLLKASANLEEIRKKYQSTGWTPKQPSPLAQRPA